MRTSLVELLQLTSPPVAIAFVDAAPPSVAHVSAAEPASCGYWRRAAAGEVFFTVADDHKGCPVGAHTHNVPLSPGEQLRVTFRLHADRTSFTGVDLRCIVEPGEIRVMVGASSHDIRLRGRSNLSASCAPSAMSGCS